MARDFNPNAARTVKFTFDPDDDGVAGTSGGEITYGAKYMIEHPKDTDVVTHEAMHVVQAYTKPNSAGWLVEGIADYARYRYGVNNAAAGWSLGDYNANQKYTDAYQITARFLVWVEKRHQGVVKRLDFALRAGTYSGQKTWKDITGASVDENWRKYAANPRI